MLERNEVEEGMNYVIVGEAPARDGSRKNLDVALACRCVRRQPRFGTMGWMETNHRLLFNFMMQTIHVNLLPEWPGTDGKGSKFPMPEGRKRATLFARNMATPSIVTSEGKQFRAFDGRRFSRPDLVLMAGWRVAMSFGVKHKDREYFVTTLEDPLCAGLSTVVVPHPSGINRWWNDEGNRTIARMFLESLG